MEKATQQDSAKKACLHYGFNVRPPLKDTVFAAL